jgi:hypothetical protein
MLVNQDSYWIITIGKTSIALQAKEVAFIAPIADLIRDSATISISGQEVPVYAFNDNFQLRDIDHSQFRFCVCLVSNQRDVFALAIKSIKQEVISAKVVLYDLPLIMSNPLFEKLAEIDNQATLISASSKIWQEIQFQLRAPAASSTILKVS